MPTESTPPLAQQSDSRLLIVEDEAKIAQPLIDSLEEEGYSTEWLSDGEAALRMALREDFSLIILDVILPGKKDGFEILKGIRSAGSSVPILMLTARSAIEDKLRGLQSGADDYLAKPFYVEELLARVGALIRRANDYQEFGSTPVHADCISLGKINLNRLTRTVVVGEAELTLTLREFDLLEYLMRAPNSVRPRAKIINALWKYGLGSKDHILDVYIGRLRKHLSQSGAPDMIETIRGVGYRIVVDSQEGS